MTYFLREVWNQVHLPPRVDSLFVVVVQPEPDGEEQPWMEGADVQPWVGSTLVNVVRLAIDVPTLVDLLYCSYQQTCVDGDDTVMMLVMVD